MHGIARFQKPFKMIKTDCTYEIQEVGRLSDLSGKELESVRPVVSLFEDRNPLICRSVTIKGIETVTRIRFLHQ